MFGIVKSSRVDTVVSIRPALAVEAFGDRTLEHADYTLDEIRWNVGVDQEAVVLELSNSFQADWRLIETGLRDDDAIRRRATATLRRLSAIFIRADAAGLLDYGALDPASLSCPDFLDELSR